MLPGSRLPDPSVLRSHPVTAERVARLQSLKLDGAGSLTPDAGMPGEGLAPPRPRPSLVPHIARHAGPSLPRLHALLDDSGVVEVVDDSTPAASGPLNPPTGAPRIRVTRGGVWW
jgi:heat shock protein HtpX